MQEVRRTGAGCETEIGRWQVKEERNGLIRNPILCERLFWGDGKACKVENGCSVEDGSGVFYHGVLCPIHQLGNLMNLVSEWAAISMSIINTGMYVSNINYFAQIVSGNHLQTCL